MTVHIRFLPDDITVEAEVGDLMLDVADRGWRVHSHRLLNGLMSRLHCGTRRWKYHPHLHYCCSTRTRNTDN